MPDQVRILIVDDHVLVRSTVADRLRQETALQIVGLAGTAEEAVGLALAGRPDIVLMDIDLDGASGLQAARQIREAVPSARFIFVSAFVYDRYIQEALLLHASGYVSKREPLEVLIAAVRNVAAGERYFSPQVLRRLVIDRQGVRIARESRTRASTLTERELEILSNIAQGLAKKDIAARLAISVNTVERHCENLMDKLNIHDRVKLARFAIREGYANL